MSDQQIPDQSNTVAMPESSSPPTATESNTLGSNKSPPSEPATTAEPAASSTVEPAQSLVTRANKKPSRPKPGTVVPRSSSKKSYKDSVLERQAAFKQAEEERMAREARKAEAAIIEAPKTKAEAKSKPHPLPNTWDIPDTYDPEQFGHPQPGPKPAWGLTMPNDAPDVSRAYRTMIYANDDDRENDKGTEKLILRRQDQAPYTAMGLPWAQNEQDQAKFVMTHHMKNAEQVVESYGLERDRRRALDTGHDGEKEGKEPVSPAFQRVLDSIRDEQERVAAEEEEARIAQQAQTPKKPSRQVTPEVAPVQQPVTPQANIAQATPEKPRVPQPPRSNPFIRQVTPEESPVPQPHTPPTNVRQAMTEDTPLQHSPSVGGRNNSPFDTSRRSSRSSRTEISEHDLPVSVAGSTPSTPVRRSTDPVVKVFEYTNGMISDNTAEFVTNLVDGLTTALWWTRYQCHRLTASVLGPIMSMLYFLFEAILNTLLQGFWILLPLSALSIIVWIVTRLHVDSSYSVPHDGQLVSSTKNKVTVTATPISTAVEAKITAPSNQQSHHQNLKVPFISSLGSLFGSVMSFFGSLFNLVGSSLGGLLNRVASTIVFFLTYFISIVVFVVEGLLGLIMSSFEGLRNLSKSCWDGSASVFGSLINMMVFCWDGSLSLLGSLVNLVVLSWNGFVSLCGHPISSGGFGYDSRTFTIVLAIIVGCLTFWHYRLGVRKALGKLGRILGQLWEGPCKVAAKPVMYWLLFVLWSSIMFLAGFGFRDLYDGFEKVTIVAMPC